MFGEKHDKSQSISCFDGNSIRGLVAQIVDKARYRGGDCACSRPGFARVDHDDNDHRDHDNHDHRDNHDDATGLSDRGRVGIRRVSWRDRSVWLSFPEILQPLLEAVLAGGDDAQPPNAPGLEIVEVGRGLYTVRLDKDVIVSSVSAGLAVEVALDQLVRGLITDVDDAVVLHAASVAWGDRAVLVAGPTGAGKTSIAGWLVSRGFGFLSDEVAVLDAERKVSTFPRPLLTKSADSPIIEALRTSVGADHAAIGPGAAISIPGSKAHEFPVGLLVFPQFDVASSLRVSALSAGQVLLRLMECNLNARNLPDHGLGILKRVAAQVPAIRLTYRGFDELENVLDHLSRYVLERNLGPGDTADLVAILGAVTQRAQPAPVERTAAAIQAPRASKAPSLLRPKPPAPPKLTIGMATYDDYDGVYFTIQAIRLYHPEVLDDIEFVVVDNNPDGRAADALRALEHWIPNLRYIPNIEVKGTAVRDFIFEEASGAFVLCMDCHVLLVEGALSKLLDYIERDPRSNDLLQGPLIYDGLQSFSTHFKPVWRGGMFGAWEADPAAADASAPPFEIPMQGLGLFACRRAAWPGFNRRFRGFGGEEGYIHEKFRQRGGRVLCLPFMRWLHRFHRPFGIPYRNDWTDRIHNYMVGFRELGWDTGPMEQHFREHLGEAVAQRILADVRRELGDEPTSTLSGPAIPSIAEPL